MLECDMFYPSVPGYSNTKKFRQGYRVVTTNELVVNAAGALSLRTCPSAVDLCLMRAGLDPPQRAENLQRLSLPLPRLPQKRPGS